MNLVLIRTQAEFDAYTEKFNFQHAVKTAEWPKPASFPCLLDALVCYDHVSACFVYPAAARALLRADKAAKTQAAGNRKPPQGPTPHDFERHVSAAIMTIVQELTEVKVTNEDRFSKLFAANLATVDRLHEEEKTDICHNLAIRQRLQGKSG